MGSAALDLNIGVSALSQQMSRLENELAICLLRRTLQGVTPTSAGLTFYSQAQLAFHHADGAILTVRESRLPGRVSVNMAPSTASVLGMPFINAMRESYNNVRLHMVGGFSGNLEWMTSTRQIDLTVVFQKEEILRWSVIPILEKRLFLIGIHALLADIAGDNIALTWLTSIPLIMPSPGHGLCDRLEVICQKHALNIKIAAEIDGLALLIRAVRSGIDVTLQPGTAIFHLDKETLRVIGIHNPMLSRSNFPVSLSNDELTPAGLAAHVVSMKMMHQLMEAGSWPGVIFYNN